MIYLACPYSHKDPKVREARFEAVTEAAGQFMSAGIHVFSHITHCHPIAKKASLPMGWEFWADYARRMIEACGTLAILHLDGWMESAGVAADLKIARELDNLCAFVKPGSTDLWYF